MMFTSSCGSPGGASGIVHVEPRLAQTERLVNTATLGFAASEAAGRFRDHSRRQLDADFELLQGLLGRFIEFESQIVGDERRMPNIRSAP
jgi:hypothetical protein